MQHILSPWATKADVEVASDELKADIAALHDDVRAVRVLLTNLLAAQRTLGSSSTATFSTGTGFRLATPLIS
jgi:hypothetical protein